MQKGHQGAFLARPAELACCVATALVQHPDQDCDAIGKAESGQRLEPRAA
jgi:hypothetical protein